MPTESPRSNDRRSSGGTGGGGVTRSSSRRSQAQDDEDRIGPYLIDEEIGRGSFATVYRGERFVRLRTHLPPPPPPLRAILVTTVPCPPIARSLSERQ